MRQILAAGFACWVAGSPLLHADELIRRVQEELRKRKCYFGNVDGRNSPGVEAALRRYQARKGVAETGEADATTLSSLGITRNSLTATGAVWPDEPVLRSDAALMASAEGVWEGDAHALPPIGEGTDRPLKDDLVVTPETGDGSAAAGANRLVAEAAETIREYLRDCESNNLNAEMAYYADKVDYFDHGTVDQEFMRKDIAAYYERWPERSYRLLDLKVLPGKPGSRIVEARFRIRFDVKNERSSVSGETDNVFRMREGENGLKFISLRESRVRS